MILLRLFIFLFFFFNDTATTEIYTLSLHDALPISVQKGSLVPSITGESGFRRRLWIGPCIPVRQRSEEHTSELQSRLHLVCRLLLEKKKKKHQLHSSWSIIIIYSRYNQYAVLCGRR